MFWGGAVRGEGGDCSCKPWGGGTGTSARMFCDVVQLACLLFSHAALRGSAPSAQCSINSATIAVDVVFAQTRWTRSCLMKSVRFSSLMTRLPAVMSFSSRWLIFSLTRGRSSCPPASHCDPGRFSAAKAAWTESGPLARVDVP